MGILGQAMADSLRKFADCEHANWKCQECGCSTSIGTLTMNERILRQAIEDGGLDISPCGKCGTPVVCVPDGLTFCKTCAEEENRGSC